MIHQTFDQAVEHHQAGRLREAEQLYRKILAQNPNHPGALHHLGIMSEQLGQRDAAIELMRRAIAVDPNVPEAHNNLGNVLTGKGQLDEAIAAYRRAIALRPDYPEAHGNLGSALKNTGRLDQAIAALRRAIALKPDFLQAHINLGAAYQNNRQLNEAIAAYRQAIALDPNLPDVHSDLAIAYRDAGQLDESVAAFRKTIALRPADAKSFNNLGVTLKDLGQLDEAIAAYRQCLALDPTLSDADSNLVFATLYHPGHDAESIAREFQRWSDQHAAPLRKFIRPPALSLSNGHTNDRNPDRRLRIGYVSADFFDHSSLFFIDPLLRHHDHTRFEIFCYAQMLHSDGFTERMRTCADHWHDTRPWTDEQFAQQVRSDQIDILVDLKLHTAGNRLLTFARKPAPIQVSWLGHPGSSGLDTIDYRITDQYLEPIGSAQPSPDQPIYLPGCFWCFDPLIPEPLPNALPALTAGFITFGSLNNFTKISDPTLRLWAAAMKSVPGSRLLLLAPQGSARQRVLATFKNLAVDPARVEFVDRQPRARYLQLHHRIDIALDTLPYNGHTTSLDAFWMGVPVVTLAGQTVVGRAGISQLNNLGLPELIAATGEQFVQIVSDLAGDLPRLSNLRQTLRRRLLDSPLGNTEKFTRDMESAYRQMWRAWCAKSPAGE
ncbi:MAG: tetratricopeptide repeat protein [Tepidisphaeraceae bacterium]|jgi:predicted O-linked N-acetylglucosamine transferase (SPINDLY family)